MTNLPPNIWFQELVVRTLQDLGGTASRSAIYGRAKELHRFTEAELAVPPPPRNRGNFGDRITYELSFALSHLKKGGRIDNPERGLWSLHDKTGPPISAPRALDNPSLLWSWEEKQDQDALAMLARRGVIEGEPNRPVGQYARYMTVCTLGGGHVQGNGSAYHVEDANGRRLQVQARHIRARPPNYYPLNLRRDEKDFDFVIAALYREDYSLDEAWLVPWDVVSSAAKPNTKGGWRLPVRGDWRGDPNVESLDLFDPQGV